MTCTFFCKFPPCMVWIWTQRAPGESSRVEDLMENFLFNQTWASFSSSRTSGLPTVELQSMSAHSKSDMVSAPAR